MPTTTSDEAPTPEDAARRVRLLFGIVVDDGLATTLAHAMSVAPAGAPLSVWGQDVVTGLPRTEETSPEALLAVVLP